MNKFRSANFFITAKSQRMAYVFSLRYLTNQERMRWSNRRTNICAYCMVQLMSKSDILWKYMLWIYFAKSFLLSLVSCAQIHSKCTFQKTLWNFGLNIISYRRVRKKPTSILACNAPWYISILPRCFQGWIRSRCRFLVSVTFTLIHWTFSNSIPSHYMVNVGVCTSVHGV